MEIDYYFASIDYGWIYIIPSIEYRHKYWYLWEISFSWLKKSIVIQLCRKDWNKNEEFANMPLNYKKAELFC